MLELSRRLASKDRCVISHFCQFKHEETLKPGLIVARIAVQLAEKIEAYKAAVEGHKDAEELERLLQHAQDKPELAMRNVVIAPLQQIMGQGRPRQIVLILDGLDESLEIDGAPGLSGGRGTTLVDLVLDPNVNLPPWFRVLIASRPIDRVLTEEVQRHFRLLSLEPDDGVHGDSDVLDYVRARAEGTPEIKRFVDDARRSTEALAKQIRGESKGRFLLARLVLDDIASNLINADRFDHLPVRVGAFYDESFTVRISRFGLEPARVQDLLGLVAVARAPLAPVTLAAILAEMPSEPHPMRWTGQQVLDIFNAFSGLLIKDGVGGINFAHFSLKQWLEDRDGLGASTPLRYRVDAARAEAALLEYCKKMSKLALDDTGAFQRYLEEFGVELFVKRREFACAAELQNSMRAMMRELRKPNMAERRAQLTSLEQDCAKQSTLLMDQMRLQWRRVDGETGSRRLTARSPFQAIEPAFIEGLLLGKDYETGKYVPVIRALIECHAAQWEVIEADLLGRADENDIVFRHDTGVAYAQAWHAATGPEKSALFEKIETMARDVKSGDRREIAAYALKYICGRTDGTLWWEPVQGRIKELAQQLAQGPSPTDRMVAGEMLLSLAVQDVEVTSWFADTIGKPPFWKPYWPNHRADINAIRALLKVAPGPEDMHDTSPESLQRCREQSELAVQLREHLRASNLFLGTQFGLRYVPILDGDLAQQSHAEDFDQDAVEALAQLLHGDNREDVLRFFKCLMLHPLWNGTELASTLLAATVRLDPVRLKPLVEQLAADAGPAWRIRYGAIDTAYNCGTIDQEKYGTFFRLLVQHGLDASCRVRGICIDNLNGWIRDAEVAELDARLNDPEVQHVIREWLKTANDIWLLEYLHEMFDNLRRLRHWSKARIDALMGPAATQLSRYFDNNANFYQLPAEDILKKADDIRAAEWQAQGAARSA